jgi:putative ribosome biogenesis GTPase RsgA
VEEAKSMHQKNLHEYLKIKTVLAKVKGLRDHDQAATGEDVIRVPGSGLGKVSLLNRLLCR